MASLEGIICKYILSVVQLLHNQSMDLYSPSPSNEKQFNVT